jgi:hypothetical protein
MNSATFDSDFLRRSLAAAILRIKFGESKGYLLRVTALVEI